MMPDQDQPLVIFICFFICCLRVGSIICDVNSPMRTTTKIAARIVIFNIQIPLTKGFMVCSQRKMLSSFCYRNFVQWANLFELWRNVYKGLLIEGARKLVLDRENSSYRGSSNGDSTV